MQPLGEARSELLTTQEAAEFLKLSRRTLEAHRVRGDGPPYVRLSSRCIRYRPSDIDRWLAERVRGSTSEDVSV